MRWALGAWAIMFLLSCVQVRGDTAEIDQIILRLQKRELQERALDDLAKLQRRGLSVEESLVALRAAAEKFPGEKGFNHPSRVLVDAASTANLRGAHWTLIEELFDKYTDSARTSALLLLANGGQRKAAETYVRLVEKYGAELSELPTATLKRDSRNAEVYLRLTPAMKHDRLASSIALMLLDFCAAKLAPQDVLLSCEKEVLRVYRKNRDLALPRQQDGIAWMDKEDYSVWRGDLGIFLDLMGYIPTGEVRKELRAAMEFRDPVPKVFAIQSLLMLGEKVDAKDAELVAVFAEKRCLLVDILTRFGKQDLLPEKYKTQAMLAEGNMVNWLVYPTELGRAPDEIELMKVITVKTPDGLSDYFLFRFRTLGDHWAAKDGWMAGVTGPYLKQNQPTTSDGGDTFSTFAKWESKTPDEHVQAIRELIAESWKRRARELEKK